MYLKHFIFKYKKPDTQTHINSINILMLENVIRKKRVKEETNTAFLVMIDVRLLIFMIRYNLINQIMLI